jgi:hypothetical protein
MFPQSGFVVTRVLLKITAVLAAASFAIVGACSGVGTMSAPGNPLPVLLALTPSVVNAGAATATVRVSGTAFLHDSRVRWDGADRPTRYVSSTELAFDLAAGDIAAMDTVAIVVVNPAPGGGSSGSLPLIIGYPVPTITSVSPASFAMGSTSVFLTITGTGFTNRTTVRWGSETAVFAANVMSPTQLRVQIPSFEYPAAGTYMISARNPAPGGGESNRLPVIVSSASQSLGAR